MGALLWCGTSSSSMGDQTCLVRLVKGRDTHQRREGSRVEWIGCGLGLTGAW